MFGVDSQVRRRPGPAGARAAAGIPLFEVCCAGEERHGGPGELARTVLCVSGEVDLVSSPRLAAAVAGALKTGHPDVLVDLARVDFIDITGIRVLVNAARQAREAGGCLVLRSPSRAVRRMLDVLHLAEVLPVEQ